MRRGTIETLRRVLSKHRFKMQSGKRFASSWKGCPTFHRLQKCPVSKKELLKGSGHQFKEHRGEFCDRVGSELPPAFLLLN